VIGAILILTFLSLTYATAIGVLPPEIQQNAEFEHSRELLTDMEGLAADIQETSETGRTHRSVVELGTQYPSYVIFPQPPGPAGNLFLSQDTYQVEIRNAAAVDSDIQAYVDGSTIQFETRTLRFHPNYNQYRRAPQTVITPAGLVNEYDDREETTTSSSLVAGRAIHLTSYRGDIDQIGTSAVTVESEHLSSNQDTIQVSNTGSTSHIEIRIETTQPLTVWRALLEDQIDGDTSIGDSTDSDAEFISEVEMDTSSTPNEVVIHLEEGARYKLGMAALGVTSTQTPRVPESQHPSTAYITRETIEEPRVREGNSIDLTTRVRDEFNNPDKDILVEASADDGTIVTTRKETRADGRVTFSYEAPNIDDPLGDVNEKTDTVTVEVVDESGSEYQVQFTVHIQNTY